MTPAGIQCDGITVAGMEVPPFELRSGEMVCLHMPCLPSPAWDEFVEAITGKKKIAGLRIEGQVRWAERAQPRRGLAALFRQPYAEDWLQAAAHISAPDARALVTSLGLPLRQKLGSLGGNWRLLLALEAAYACKVDVIVYSTAGCDPMGVKAVHESVTAKLDRWAALRLSFQDIHGRYWDEGHAPNGCPQVSARLPVSTARNSLR